MTKQCQKGSAAEAQCFDCGLKAEPTGLSLPQGPKASTEKKFGHFCTGMLYTGYL